MTASARRLILRTGIGRGVLGRETGRRSASSIPLYPLYAARQRPTRPDRRNCPRIALLTGRCPWVRSAYRPFVLVSSGEGAGRRGRIGFVSSDRVPSDDPDRRSRPARQSPPKRSELRIPRAFRPMGSLGASGNWVRSARTRRQGIGFARRDRTPCPPVDWVRSAPGDLPDRPSGPVDLKLAILDRTRVDSSCGSTTGRRRDGGCSGTPVEGRSRFPIDEEQPCIIVRTARRVLAFATPHDPRAWAGCRPRSRPPARRSGGEPGPPPLKDGSSGPRRWRRTTRDRGARRVPNDGNARGNGGPGRSSASASTARGRHRRTVRAEERGQAGSRGKGTSLDFGGI